MIYFGIMPFTILSRNIIRLLIRLLPVIFIIPKIEFYVIMQRELDRGSDKVVDPATYLVAPVY